MATTGKEPAYCDEGIAIAYLWIAVGVASVALVATIFVVALYLMEPTSQFRKTALFTAWLGWLVAPPLWFAFESLILFKNYGPVGAFDAFKHGQDVGSKVWLGIAAALTVIVAK